MRRKDKEITDIQEIEEIIRRSLVCRLALSDDGIPYVISLCFGYEDHTLYFHAAGEGKKLAILRKNNQVCVEFDIDQELVRGTKACDWGMKYRSVIGFGRATVLNDLEGKNAALQVIMRQYGDQENFEFSAKLLQKTAIIKVDIEQLSGKVAGY